MFSEEQEEAAQRIIRAYDSNLYDVLSLSRACTDGDIKKTYRKLALRFHPDKNPAPSAKKAFLIINEAMQTLSNSSSRERYDTLGHSTAMKDSGSAQPARSAQWPTQWPKQISPKDLANRYFRFNSALSNDSSSISKGGLNPVITLFPSILLLCVSFVVVCIFKLGLVDYTLPPFALYQSKLYSKLRHTSSPDVLAGIPYYTATDFDSRFSTPSTELSQLEVVIEWRYRSSLADSCAHERLQFIKDHNFGECRVNASDDGATSISQRVKCKDPVGEALFPSCRLYNSTFILFQHQ